MKRYGIGSIDIVLIGILLLSLAGYLAVRLSGRRKRSRTGPWIWSIRSLTVSTTTCSRS